MGLSAPGLEMVCIEDNGVLSTEGIEGAPALVKLEARGNKIAALTGLSEAHESLSFLDLRS